MGTTPCGCTLQCFDKIPEEQRKRSFTGFREMGDFNIQKAKTKGNTPKHHHLDKNIQESILSKTEGYQSRCANQRSSPYTEFAMVDWSVQSMLMNMVDIPLEILHLSRHTFKVSLNISHIILVVTTHTEST